MGLRQQTCVFGQQAADGKAGKVDTGKVSTGRVCAGRVCGGGFQVIVAAQHAGKGALVGHGPGKAVVHGLRYQVFGRLAQRLGRGPDRGGEVGQRGAGRLGCGLHLINQAKGGFAVIHHLAADKVHRLNAIGAFVD